MGGTAAAAAAGHDRRRAAQVDRRATAAATTPVLIDDGAAGTAGPDRPVATSAVRVRTASADAPLERLSGKHVERRGDAGASAASTAEAGCHWRGRSASANRGHPRRAGTVGDHADSERPGGAPTDRSWPGCRVCRRDRRDHERRNDQQEADEE